MTQPDLELMPARLLSMAQSAERLNCGRARIYELINAGQLKTMMVGRRRFTTERFIREYIASLEKNAS